MKLQEIVKGADVSAQLALNKLFANLAHEEERILWYPSSGSDFRDLLETLSPERQALHGLSEAPNIFIHTAYISDDITFNLGVIRNDGRTIVEVQEKYDIHIQDNIDLEYNVSSEYAVFPELASIEPIIYLVKLRLTSNILGVVEGWLFYFCFENHNFLQEVILKQKLRITHLVKVREGLGFGSNRLSITLVYALLANIGVRYLLADEEVAFVARTHVYLTLRFAIDHQAFELKRIGQKFVWSGFGVSAYQIAPKNRSMQHDDLTKVLSTISQNSRTIDNLMNTRGE